MPLGARRGDTTASSRHDPRAVAGSASPSRLTRRREEATVADSKWIDFLERPPNPKTRLWRVVSKKGGDSLGRIEWYGPWRKYAFEPHESTVYEEDCLRDIAAFVEDRKSTRLNSSHTQI